MRHPKKNLSVLRIMMADTVPMTDQDLACDWQMLTVSMVDTTIWVAELLEGLSAAAVHRLNSQITVMQSAICMMKRPRQNIDVLLVVTGRIICSKGCQQILSGMHRLVQESRAKGTICLASPDYPPGFTVTITAGQDNSTDSQTDTILPAAVSLLPSFAHDHRELASCGSVQLVKGFVYRCHKLWYFNQTYTAVLFKNVPSNGFVNVNQTVPACRVLCRFLYLHLKACLPLLLAGSLAVTILFCTNTRFLQHCKACIHH
jgi:hypothetical protein